MLFFTLRLASLRHIWRGAAQNKVIFLGFVAIFALLTWPTGVHSTYDVGADLGILRLVRIILFLLLFLMLTASLAITGKFPNHSPLYLFFAYIIVCFGSAVYSPNPLETIWKSIEILVLFLFALKVQIDISKRRIEPEDILSILVLFLLFSVINAIIGGVLFADAAYQVSEERIRTSTSSMGGIIPQLNANSLAQYSAMLVLFGFVSLIQLGRVSAGVIFVILVGIAGLGLAYSRTSIIAVAVAILILAPKRGLGRSFLIITAGIALGIVFVPEIITYLARGQNTELLISMSGRTHMWTIGWEAFLEQPFFGHGFYSGHKTLDIDIGMEFSSLDSTYLEALVDVGVLGAFFLVAFVVLVVVSAYRSLRRARFADTRTAEWLLVTSGFVFIMLIRSLTGSSFQVLHWNLLTILMIAACWSGMNQRSKFKLQHDIGRE